MTRLTLLLATAALALTPMAAKAGNLRTIGLHTSPPVLTTGIAAKPMIQVHHSAYQPAQRSGHPASCRRRRF